MSPLQKPCVGFCSQCAWWNEYLDEPKVGECQRFPPQLVTADQSLWPVTEADDWCGEWEAEEPPKVGSRG